MNLKKSTSMELTELRNRLEQEKGKCLQIENTITRIQADLITNKRSLRQHEQAREIIREAGLKTQQELQIHISDITSLALDAVFDNPYQLVAEFVQRRNKTECDLYFFRDGERTDPLSATGGGVVDVASFALRIASWSMQTPRSSNTIILDEPFKHLSTNYQENASEMIKELSKKLGIQFIIVTHEIALAMNADKTFEVKSYKGTSRIRAT